MATKRTDMKPFFEFLDTQVNNHSIYCLGTQGETVASLTINKIVSLEDGKANAARVLRHIAELLPTSSFDINKAKSFDCSGLGCNYLQNITGVYTYDHKANDMYKECVEIPMNKLQPGDFVFGHFYTDGRAGHVGYVDADGYIVEARGRDYGVVKRKVADGDWTKAGRPNVWNYEMHRALKRGDIGTDVGQLQARLKHFGYDCGTVDNDFGVKTYNALARFQEAKYPKAPEIGVMDKKTAKKLGFTLVTS